MLLHHLAVLLLPLLCPKERLLPSEIQHSIILLSQCFQELFLLLVFKVFGSMV